MAELESGGPVGPTYVIGELHELQRGAVAGYNEKPMGKFVELLPRIAKRDHYVLQQLRKEELPGYLESRIHGLAGMSEEVAQAYLQSHKAVMYEHETGETEAVVVPRTYMGADDIDLDESQLPVELGLVVNTSKREKKRRYTLHQLINDVSLADKYPITVRQRETFKRMSATNPQAAARLWQDQLNAMQTHTAITVMAETSIFDKKRAKAAIRMLASVYTPTSAAIHSLVCGREIIMYGPGGEDDWHVRGGLEHTYEVRDLHTLMSHLGGIDVSLLLSIEIAVLSMNICIAGDYAAPVVTYHVGSPYRGVTVEQSATTLSLVSVEQRMALAALGDRLLPITDGNGQAVATAVRVTGRHILLNSHVLDAVPDCKVDGGPVRIHKAVARDVWSALLDGEAKPWVIREVDVGEVAVICYRSGNTVSFTSPVRVLSVEGTSIITTKTDDAAAGTSGGALVALSDMALLGVHSAATNYNLLSYMFSPTQFRELLDGDDISSVSRKSDTDSFGERAYLHFKKRGLGHVVQAAMASLVPVFVEGKHIGMAMRRGNNLYTTCAPDLPLRLGINRVPAIFSTVQLHKQYVTDNLFPDLKTPVFTRKPEYFEKVFVIGFDDEDAYFSAESMVSHVGPDARSFVISDIAGLDKPVLGGIVVAWDGAVLGQCGSRSVSTPVGIGFTVYALPEAARQNVTDPVDVLKAAFPFLNVEAWGGELLEEIFTHSSVNKYSSGRVFNAGNKPLANVGDNVAKERLYRTMRELLVPHAQWSLHMQRLQSNKAYAERAWQYKYASCLRVGQGIELLKDSKSYADLTEALIGAAALAELPETVDKLCDVMGITYKKPETVALTIGSDEE